MSLPRLLIILFFSVLTTGLACGQTGSPLDPYLLRIEHGNWSSSACVLLQKNGAYHLEVAEVENTKVFEGTLKADDLQQVETNLRSLLQALSQGQIEEPLIRHRELLKLDIPRNGQWYEVRFLSAESEEPFRQSLQPILRWLNDLHKMPHKELSEDAGKNNCLVPGKIALKKRSDETPPQSSKARGAPVPSQQPSSEPASPNATSVLLRLDSFGVKSDIYHEDCVLVVADGSYRAEDRSQKAGSKKVDARLNGGRLTPIEISQLQELLSDSALAEIQHRRTSHLELPVSGEMLELKIPRPSGLQEIVLSSTFNRSGIPFFYSGDGDIARARPLMKFLSEHVNNHGLGILDPNLRNGCTEAP